MDISRINNVLAFDICGDEWVGGGGEWKSGLIGNRSSAAPSLYALILSLITLNAIVMAMMVTNKS